MVSLIRILIGFLLIATCEAAPAVGLHYGRDDSISQYEEFGAWANSRITYRVTFCGMETWSDIANPWFIKTTSAWINSANDRYEILTVPLIPKSEINFDNVLRGSRDFYFRSLAQKIKDRGLTEKVIIRLGWEANGDWYPWNYLSDPEKYKQAFRRAVLAMREIAPVRIEWNISNGASQINWKLGYPGDDVVDIISMDVYDHWIPWDSILNGPAGLKSLRDFALSKNKREAYSEWGVVTKANGHGDNPSFITNMYNWFQHPNVIYQAYWNTSDVGGRIFGPEIDAPNSAAMFLKLFGSPLAPSNLVIQ